jgi:hypothetical protein
VVEFEVRPLHGDEVFGPQTADRSEAFLEAGAQSWARHSESLEFDVAIANPDAEDELATTQQVERRKLFGNVGRLVQQHQHQPTDDPQMRCDRPAIGEKRNLLHGLEWVRDAARTLYDAIEAQTIGASHQFDIVVKMSSHVAGRTLAVDNQPEHHRRISATSWANTISSVPTIVGSSADDR